MADPLTCEHCGEDLAEAAPGVFYHDESGSVWCGERNTGTVATPPAAAMTSSADPLLETIAKAVHAELCSIDGQHELLHPMLLVEHNERYVIVVFCGGMSWLAWNDHVAVRHCHHLGGQTYDSGQHCVIGGKTVSTR